MLRGVADTYNHTAWTVPVKNVCLQEAVLAPQLNGSHGEYTGEDDLTKDNPKKTKKKNTNKVSVVVNNAPSGVASAASVNVEKLVSAILLQDKPYVLPRYTGAPVAPHQYRWQKQLSLDSADLYKTGFIFSNDPDKVLQIGQATSTDNAILAGSYNSDPGVVANWPSSRIYMDQNLPLIGNHTLKSTIFNEAGLHWSNSSRKFVPGAKYYPCMWGPDDPVKFESVIYNTSGKVATCIARLECISDGVAGYTLSIQSDLASNGNTTFDFAAHANFDVFCDHMRQPNRGFAVSYFLSTPVQMNYGATYGIAVGNILLSTPFTWRHYSLWNLISDGAVAKAQYEKASRYNVTGNAITLTNTSSNYVKGGSIYAARLPGNSQGSLGGTLDSMIKVISSQTHHVLRSPSLETGMHYSFTPEKIQDWLFERSPDDSPYDGDPQNIPYCAAVIDATGVQVGAVPTFILTGIMSIEYLTVDPSNWIVNSPANSMIFDALLTGLASQNCLSENPDHFANVKRLVRKIMTEDNMKVALKTMVNAGVKIAPFVLSLL